MKARLFRRLFLIQGLWNYRTLLGPGMLWALLPLLRSEYRNDAEALEAALERHSGLFNAHPYLAGFAAGALARMEVDREPGSMIQRFREVIRGPLGSLGDRFFWAAWLPTTILLAGAAGLMGLPAPLTIFLFLGVYNAAHLVVRWQGLEAGWIHGRGVAEGLARMGLPDHAERTGRGGVMLLGLVLGWVVVRALDPDLMHTGTAILLVGSGGFLFVAGILRGRESTGWPPAFILFVIVALFGWGWISG